MRTLNGKYSAAVFILCFYVVINLSPHATTSTALVSTASPTPILGKTLTEIEQVQQLMHNNAGCQLPCFWQFQPRQTTLKDVTQFIGIDYREDLKDKALDYNFYVSGTKPPDEALMSIGFEMDNSLLRRMTVFLQQPNKWLPVHTMELSSLLAKMNSKPEIYVAIKASTMRFFLVVVYNQQGVMAQYTFDFEEDQFFPYTSKPIHLCPRKSQNTSIILWLQNSEDKSLVEDLIYPAMPTGSLRNDKFRRPIAFVTNLDTESFIKYVLANPEGCIDALSFDELSKRGQEF